MDCRPKCAACCIAISISSPIPGMPNGKAAGEPCIQLADDFSCKIFGQPERPKTCILFQAEKDFCGRSTEEAFIILSDLEKGTIF